MNIAILSDYNIAGQSTFLMRAINKYTEHKARCIIAHDDTFAYDHDILLDSDENKEVAADWCKKADFFHFGRGIFNWKGIDFNQLLNKHNCCIKYYGSELRNSWQTLQKYHQETGIAAITGTDWSITGHLTNSFYHLGSYFTKYGDLRQDEIPWCVHPMDVGLKVCAGSAGSPLKRYDLLESVVMELQDKGYKIGLDFISGLSNEKCLERKRQSNCTFTSLHGAWGISGIESMFLGHIVLSCLDPWIMTLYPENPTIIINQDNLKEILMSLLPILGNDLDALRTIGNSSRQFAIKNFNTKVILKRYLYLIDLIMNGDEYLSGGKNPKYIYNNF